MGKGNGSTRSSASSNPRGLSSAPAYSTAFNQNGVVNSRNDNEEIAERLYRNGLTVDPGDATFELARNLNHESIESSIEGTTDYFATATRDYIQVGNNNLETGEAMREWGADDVVNIPYGNRSLMDIIMELRTSNVADIYRKYR